MLNERGVGKIYDFWPISRCISVTVRDMVTGSRLAPNLVTLNDLERQNREFYFFRRFWVVKQVYIIYKVAPRYYCYAIQVENLVFVY